MSDLICPRPDKKRYAHKVKAKRVLRRRGGGISPLHVYRCQCGLFHIGHKRGGVL